VHCQPIKREKGIKGKGGKDKKREKGKKKK